MNKVLIGSTRLKELFNDFTRDPKDVDYAVDVDGVQNIDGVEYLYNPIITKKYTELGANELLSLKMSHLFWDTNWDKHMYDVQFLLSKNCKLNYTLFKELRSFFEEYLPKVQRSNLSLDKESFFTNNVNGDTDEHDIYHTIIAEIPAYTKILKNGCEVEVCEEKFNNLTFDDKCKVVVEEAVVMAYERYSGKTKTHVAFNKQLRANIQKHYPEFIAIFAIENYKELTNIRKMKVMEMLNKLNFKDK